MGSARLLHFLKSNAVMNLLKFVTFLQDNAKKDDIINAGENPLVLLYNGDSEDDLDVLCYHLFQEKFQYVDSKDLDLPPTSPSAKFHSLS